MRRFAWALALAGCAKASGSFSGGGDEGDGGTGGDAGGGNNGPCVDGQRRCRGQSLETCDHGSFIRIATCAAPTTCVPSVGCADCQPGARVCMGNEVHQCGPDGTVGLLLDTCPSACDAGMCHDLCAEAGTSYVGCDYYAVDLQNARDPLIDAGGGLGGGICALLGVPGILEGTMNVCYDASAGLFGNAIHGQCDLDGTCATAGPGIPCEPHDVCYLDAQNGPYTIAIANLGDGDATVTLSTQAGVLESRVVTAGTVSTFAPAVNQSLEGTELSPKAFHLTSTRPVVAYQFNPLTSTGAFSNDASLLLPTPQLGMEYYGISRSHLSRRHDAMQPERDAVSVVAVIGTADGTSVTVTPTAAVLRGTGVPDGIAAGASFTTMLNAFDVLHLATSGPGDLTGTHIVADHPVSAFGSHEASAIPDDGSVCCLDHIEHELFPVSEWGTTFALGHSSPRSGRQDRWRVVASEDGTDVMTMPAIPGAAMCTGLAAGQWCELTTAANFTLTASRPIEIAGFLESSGGMSPGDPSMWIAIPVEQWRSDYLFLVPETYATNHLTIVAVEGDTGADVSVDGTTIAAGEFSILPDGMYRAVVKDVMAGPHRVGCPATCTVMVHGYGTDVSYAYAAGAETQPINIQ